MTNSNDHALLPAYLNHYTPCVKYKYVNGVRGKFGIRKQCPIKEGNKCKNYVVKVCPFLFQIFSQTEQPSATGAQDSAASSPDDPYEMEVIENTLSTTQLKDEYKSWQKCGYASLTGCVAALSVDTGKLLDIKAMSRYCKGCLKHAKDDKESPAYLVWKPSVNN